MKLSFSSRHRPTRAPGWACEPSECARNQRTHGQPELELESKSCACANHTLDACSPPRLRTCKYPHARIAQTAGARRWMRPTLASIGALERARVVATADELMGTRRPTRHHSHRISKISSRFRKPYAAHSQLAAVAPPPPCQASAAPPRTWHSSLENEVGPRTHLWPISANRRLPRRLPLAGKKCAARRSALRPPS